MTITIHSVADLKIADLRVVLKVRNIFGRQSLECKHRAAHMAREKPRVVGMLTVLAVGYARVRRK